MRNEWIPVSQALPTREDIEYILCVSGKDGNITYDHAVLLEANYWENGRFWINGVYKKDVDVLAWMPIPEPYRGEL